MLIWGTLFAVAGLLLALTAFRMEGGQTLGAKQAVYLAAFCSVVFSVYNFYQIHATRTAPAEIEAYLPLYPASHLKTRVPVEEVRAIRSIFAAEGTQNDIRGQWIFRTSDSMDDVTRFYRRWAASAPHRVGINQMTEHAEVIVDAPNYSFTVLANTDWSGTQITYTLMAPLE